MIKSEREWLAINEKPPTLDTFAKRRMSIRSRIGKLGLVILPICLLGVLAVLCVLAWLLPVFDYPPAETFAERQAFYSPLLRTGLITLGIVGPIYFYLHFALDRCFGQLNDLELIPEFMNDYSIAKFAQEDPTVDT